MSGMGLSFELRALCFVLFKVPAITAKHKVQNTKLKAQSSELKHIGH